MHLVHRQNIHPCEFKINTSFLKKINTSESGELAETKASSDLTLTDITDTHFLICRMPQSQGLQACTKVLKGMCGRVSLSGGVPELPVCGGKAKVTMKTPGCQRCQDRGMPTEESLSQ